MLARVRPVALLAAALVVATGGCSAAAKSSAKAPSSSAPPSTMASTVVPSSTTMATATTVPGNGSSAPQNISPSDATKAQLAAAYAAYMQDPPQDIGGTEQNSVYEAYLPPSATYWALARFLPSDSASQQTIVSMQDGGNIGVFDKTAGGSWTMLAKGTAPFCSSRTPLPAEVRTLWGLSDPPQCS